MDTPTRRLADKLLPKGGVAKFIAARRPDKSWRMIALDLRDETDGVINVAPETLRKWSAEIDAASSQAQPVAVPRPASAMATAS